MQRDQTHLMEYAVQIQNNKPSGMQLVIKNNVLQINNHTQMYYDENYKATRTVAAKTMPYPYTALLTKHVRSIGDRPMFYFEVKLVGDIPENKQDTKSHLFSVGLSSADFQGTKKVGDTKESVGITGDFNV